MEDDIKIIEPKDYTGDKEEAYSHSMLVMKTLKRAIDNRSKEMKDGYYNTKFDRMGNAHKVWNPDTRDEFIESVESLMMIQERDYDDDAEKDIEKVKEELNKTYKRYCNLEENEWKNLHPEIKKRYNADGHYFRKGRLSAIMPYQYEYKRDKVDAYTKIVSIIQKSIKRAGDYQEELYEA